jgi:hypothetical protein
MSLDAVRRGIRFPKGDATIRASYQDECSILLLHDRGMIASDVTAFAGDSDGRVRRSRQLAGSMDLVQSVAIHTGHAGSEMDIGR